MTTPSSDIRTEFIESMIADKTPRDRVEIILTADELKIWEAAS